MCMRRRPIEWPCFEVPDTRTGRWTGCGVDGLATALAAVVVWQRCADLLRDGIDWFECT